MLLFLPNVLTHCTNHWAWWSPRNVGNVQTRGLGWSVGRKARKAGFRHGAPSFIDACHSNREAARGLSDHDLRRLLGLWVYALSFRREALSVLDVAFVAAECFPSRRRCAVEGALLDELLVTTFLALGR